MVVWHSARHDLHVSHLTCLLYLYLVIISATLRHVQNFVASPMHSSLSVSFSKSRMYRDVQRVLLFVRWSGAGVQNREKAERRKKLTNVKNEVTTLDYRASDAVGTTESYMMVSRVVYP